MNSSTCLRGIVAWIVVTAIVAPIIAQAWPVCDDEGMSGEMRCAGLWAAGCCDYSAAKERVRGSDDGKKARPFEALSIRSNSQRDLADPVCPERLPIARAPTAHPEPGMSSTVLRL